MSEQPDKYDYARFGSKAKRVGQAVQDILNQENKPSITAEEISESRQEQYMRNLQEAADLGKKEFQSPFYVVYLYNKEHWAVNVVRGRFVRRQTEPLSENMMTMFPYYAKDVWKIDYEKGSIDYMWTLPALETFKQIQKNKQFYDENLVGWVNDPFGKKKPFQGKN